jgi:hypothetical protein
MLAEKTIDEVIAEIPFTFTSSNSGEFLYINDVLEGETIAIYGREDADSAYAHFQSLLTAEQREALTLRRELDYELILEDQGNRELCWF